MKFNKIIKIKDKKIGDRYPTFIIAEAGVNHGGDMNKAKELIDLASESGADAVKFQTFKAEHLILNDVEKAPYQQKTTDKNQSQFEMLKALEVTDEQNYELMSYCSKKKIIFLTTPFDEHSLGGVDCLDLGAYKISSTDLTNIPFLRTVARKCKPIILSTGMSYMEEIEMALSAIYQYNKDVVLLQCTANYPINDDEANLNVIGGFKNRFSINLGYSDHTVGIGAAPYSIPMGANLVEKHFTLSQSDEGPDHKASLSPEELISFVKIVRQVDNYMGTNIKIPNLSETNTRKSLQKCLVANQEIQAGDLFSEKNIIAKRTGGIGISPIYVDEIYGTKSTRSFSKNDIITI